MPVYTYRRQDGTTFDVRQKFTDEPLTVDPETGQRVVRVVQAAGIVFKGSGFYVNDSRNSSRKSANGASTTSGDDAKPAAESKSETKAETKTEAKETRPAKAEVSAAAD